MVETEFQMRVKMFLMRLTLRTNLVTYSIFCCLKQIRKPAQIQEIEI